MRITADHPKFNQTVILLNNKWCRGALAADDDEGWVEVVDISAMAPLDLEEDASSALDDDEVAFTELKTKKVYGTVEFKHLG